MGSNKLQTSWLKGTENLLRCCLAATLHLEYPTLASVLPMPTSLRSRSLSREKSCHPRHGISPISPTDRHSSYRRARSAEYGRDSRSRYREDSRSRSRPRVSRSRSMLRRRRQDASGSSMCIPGRVRAPAKDKKAKKWKKRRKDRERRHGSAQAEAVMRSPCEVFQNTDAPPSTTGCSVTPSTPSHGLPVSASDMGCANGSYGIPVKSPLPKSSDSTPPVWLQWLPEDTKLMLHSFFSTGLTKGTPVVALQEAARVKFGLAPGMTEQLFQYFHIGGPQSTPATFEAQIAPLKAELDQLKNATSEWTIVNSKDSRKLYVNTNTGISQWEEPPEIQAKNTRLAALKERLSLLMLNPPQPPPSQPAPAEWSTLLPDPSTVPWRPNLAEALITDVAELQSAISSWELKLGACHRDCCTNIIATFAPKLSTPHEFHRRVMAMGIPVIEKTKAGLPGPASQGRAKAGQLAPHPGPPYASVGGACSLRGNVNPNKNRRCSYA